MADDEKLRATQCVVSQIVKRTKKNTRTKFVCWCFSHHRLRLFLARRYRCALRRCMCESATHWCVNAVARNATAATDASLVIVHQRATYILSLSPHRRRRQMKCACHPKNTVAMSCAVWESREDDQIE